MKNSSSITIFLIPGVVGDDFIDPAVGAINIKFNIRLGSFEFLKVQDFSKFPTFFTSSITVASVQFTCNQIRLIKIKE